MKFSSSMRVIALVAGLFIAGLVSAQPQQAPSNVEYSAMSTSEFSEGAIKGRVYHKPNMERRETAAGGMNAITILRFDKKLMWMVMPNEQMYMQMPLGKPRNDDPSSYKMERTVVGPEVLNGMNTTKYKVIMTRADGSKFGGFMWQSSHGIMVKLDAIAVDGNKKSRIKMELTEIEVGPQPAALFEVPPGFQLMDMPGMNLEALMNRGG